MVEFDWQMSTTDVDYLIDPLKNNQQTENLEEKKITFFVFQSFIFIDNDLPNRIVIMVWTFRPKLANISICW